MENFFYNDEFYSDLDWLMDVLEIDETSVHDLEDDWEIECYESTLEPLFRLDYEWIIDHIDEERWTEDAEESIKVKKILEKHINFDAINDEMPKLYYGNERKKFTITKADLIEYFK